VQLYSLSCSGLQEGLCMWIPDWRSVTSSAPWMQRRALFGLGRHRLCAVPSTQLRFRGTLCSLEPARDKAARSRHDTAGGRMTRRPWTTRFAALRTAGASTAVPAGVTTARPHHPPTAPGALDCVLPVVEERRLPRRGCLHRRRLCGRLALQRVVRRRWPRSRFRRQDPDFFLLIRRQELLSIQRKM
jgi:hypothetical protein